MFLKNDDKSKTTNICLLLHHKQNTSINHKCRTIDHKWFETRFDLCGRTLKYKAGAMRPLFEVDFNVYLQLRLHF